MVNPPPLVCYWSRTEKTEPKFKPNFFLVPIERLCLNRVAALKTPLLRTVGDAQSVIVPDKVGEAPLILIRGNQIVPEQVLFLSKYSRAKGVASL